MAGATEQAQQNARFIAHHQGIEQSWRTGVFTLGHGQHRRHDRVARVHHGFAVHIVHFVAAAQSAVPAGRLGGHQATVATNPYGAGCLLECPAMQHLTQFGGLTQMRTAHPVDQVQGSALTVVLAHGFAQGLHQPCAPRRGAGAAHQRPLKTGGLFSLKASTPSCRSSVSTNWL